MQPFNRPIIFDNAAQRLNFKTFTFNIEEVNHRCEKVVMEDRGRRNRIEGNKEKSPFLYNFLNTGVDNRCYAI